MRRLLVSICALGLLVAISGSALSSGHRLLPCLDGSGANYILKFKPKRCAEFSYRGSFAGGVNLGRIEWSSWGGRSARGAGIEKGFHRPYSHIPVKIRAFRRRTKCGHKVYSRLRATSDTGSTTVKLHVCGGPA